MGQYIFGLSRERTYRSKGKRKKEGGIGRKREEETFPAVRWVLSLSLSLSLSLVAEGCKMNIVKIKM